MTDVPLTLMIFREEELLAKIITPNVDKYELLDAAYTLKQMINIDSFCSIVDSRMAIPNPGTTQDELMELNRRGLGNVLSEGGSDKIDITDCMMCISIKQDKSIESLILPYKVNGNKVEWLDSLLNIEDEMISLSGDLIDKYKFIMEQKIHPKVIEFINQTKYKTWDTDKIQYYTDLSTFKYIKSLGYNVLANPKYGNFEEEEVLS